MTVKIFRSVFFAAMIVLAVSLFFIVGILTEVYDGQIKNELKSEAEYASFAIEAGGISFFDSFNSDNRRITLIAPDGRVIADTQVNPDGMENHLDRKEVIDAIEKGSGTSTRYSSTLTEKTIYYAVKMNGGYIVRISAKQYTAATVLMGLGYPLLIVVVIGIILSLFLSSKIASSIVKPINEIDLDNPNKNLCYDELAPLLKKISVQNDTISKQLEEAYRRQKEFELITENMSEGFLIIDSRTNLISCNSAVLKLLGAEERKDGSVLALNRTEGFRSVIAKVLSGQRAENRMECLGATYSLIANPVTEEDGVIGAVIIILDITESVRREKLRREFTANVSHELKTPLTSISGFAEILKDGNTDKETEKDFAKSIYDEAQRLISLVGDIIKISELDEKNANISFEDVDLLELANNAAERMKPLAGKRNVTVSVCGAHEVVKGAYRVLEDMADNLCDNAVKYNKSGGSVEISVGKDGDSSYFAVKDTGIGIPPEDINRVFERFYRVDKGRSKETGGTGLGLSIVKHAAICHGAEIRIKSELSKGTEIKIIFSEKSEKKC